jgi:hypothetical protein
MSLHRQLQPAWYDTMERQNLHGVNSCGYCGVALWACWLISSIVAVLWHEMHHVVDMHLLCKPLAADV